MAKTKTWKTSIFISQFRNLWSNFSQDLMADNLFVGKIQNLDEQKLRDYFGQYGKISNVALCKHSKTGKPCGFGFVTFANSACTLWRCGIVHLYHGHVRPCACQTPWKCTMSLHAFIVAVVTKMLEFEHKIDGHVIAVHRATPRSQFVHITQFFYLACWRRDLSDKVVTCFLCVFCRV